MPQLAPTVGVALIDARYAGLALIAASYVGYVHIRNKTDQRLANAISNMAQLRHVFKQIDADGRCVAAMTGAVCTVLYTVPQSDGCCDEAATVDYVDIYAACVC